MSAGGTGKKPAWLAGLRPLDRVRAEKWMREVGEARFLAIAQAATAARRPRGPRQRNNDELIHAAVLYWLTHPELNERQAAAGLAGELWLRRSTNARLSLIGTQPALRRILSDGVREAAGAGISLSTAKEAEATGLPLRPEAREVLDADPVRVARVSFAKLARQTGFDVAEDGTIPAREDPFLTKLKAEMEAQRAREWRSSGMSPERLERVRRVTLVYKAVKGILPPDVPISRVAALYDNLVAAATLIAAELAESEEADPDLDEDGSYDYE